MIPTEIRLYCFEGGSSGDWQVHWVYDTDQRKWFTVSLNGLFEASDDDDFDHDELQNRVVAKILDIFKSRVDELSLDIMGLDVDKLGEVSLLKHPWVDQNRGTYYPALEEYELPESLTKTVLRSEMIELDRLSSHVDMVSYSGIAKAAFKYFHMYNGFGGWQEINLHTRLPAHPNILPIDHLVLEEVSGSRVVGFTTPFVAGGDLATRSTPRVKLRWLKQLIQVPPLL